MLVRLGLGLNGLAQGREHALDPKAGSSVEHTDLRDDFQRRAREASKLPPAFQHLEAKITDPQADNQRLRDRNRELEARNDLYAMVINELSIQVHHGQPGATQPGNVTRLRP